MATPQTPYDAVLHAARDVTKLDSRPGRRDARHRAAGQRLRDRGDRPRRRRTGVRHRLPRRHHPPPDRGGDHHPRRSSPRWCPTPRAPSGSARAARRPAWTAQLGRVHLTGSWAYGDVYGDQTSYLATFAYDDAAGGPEHALVALVDHNIGITKDVFVGGPAERILDQVRQMCADDELTWFRDRGSGPAARRGGPAPGGHRRPGRAARRGLARHRPGAGRRPAGDAAHRGRPDRPGGGRAALRGRAHRPGPRGSSPRRRPPASGWTPSTARSWPRCTSA